MLSLLTHLLALDLYRQVPVALPPVYHRHLRSTWSDGCYCERAISMRRHMRSQEGALSSQRIQIWRSANERLG